MATSTSASSRRRPSRCSASSPPTSAGRSPTWPAASTTRACSQTPGRFLRAMCRRTARSRPTMERGTLVAFCPTAPRTPRLPGWLSPSPTYPRGKPPNGQSRQRGPIPTASSTPFASRSSCSTRTLTSSPRAALFTASFRSSPSRPWADNSTRSMRAASISRRCVSFSTTSETAKRVVADHEIVVDLPPRGMRSLLVSALEIRDEPLATRKILLALEDITERKYAAQALEAAKQQPEKANLAKSRFLAAASHDLRQPLQTISLLHELLAKKVKDEITLKLVGRLDETVSTMSSMLDTLLDINQLEAGIVRREMVDFPIDAVLEHLRTQFSFHAAAHGLAWRVVP